MRKIIVAILLTWGVFLSAAGYAEKQTIPFVGEITDNDINIRCDATIASQVISTVNRHVIVDVIAEAFEWYKIKLPRNAICYIKAGYVNIVPRSEGEGSSKFGITNADSVNIRLEPNETSCILGRVNKGKALNIVDQLGDWLKITAPDTTHGWINKKFVAPLQAPPVVHLPAVPLAVRADAIPAGTEKIEKDKITVIGVIEPYGKIIGRKGTHKIISKEKKTYILRGDKKQLNSCSYRQVAVKGRLQEIPGQEYPLILVEHIEVLN